MALAIEPPRAAGAVQKPEVAKRGGEFDFFAEARPEGYDKNQARSREVWENLSGPIETLAETEELELA